MGEMNVAEGSPDFHPTHIAPRDGLPTWSAPDLSRPSPPLDPLLPVQLLDRRGDWSRVLCSNGWSAWVDGRLLITVPQGPPATGGPMSRTADPRPLLAQAERALGRYREMVEELASGRADGETFSRSMRGVRIGAVVDGDAVWLLDAEHDRWCYCDGARLTTFAAVQAPAAQAPAVQDGAAHDGAETARRTAPGTGPEPP